MSAFDVIAILGLAALQGAVVALPRAEALAQLSRLRSPAWAAALPGSILVGTFAPLWFPTTAVAIVALSAFATPLLAVVAAAAVARGRRNVVLGALALALLLAVVLGRELSATIVTAFGCLSVGVALTRLIPGRWLLIGVIVMAGLDVLLLAMHVGQPAAAVIADTSTRFHGRAFDSAGIGSMTLDYPDMVLAGVLGGFCAGQRLQRRAALTLMVLAATWEMLLAVVDLVPATPPIALTFVLVAIWERAPLARRRGVRSRTAAKRRRPASRLGSHVTGWARAARLVLAASRS